MRQILLLYFNVIDKRTITSNIVISLRDDNVNTKLTRSETSCTINSLRVKTHFAEKGNERSKQLSLLTLLRGISHAWKNFKILARYLTGWGKWRIEIHDSNTWKNNVTRWNDRQTDKPPCSGNVEPSLAEYIRSITPCMAQSRFNCAEAINTFGCRECHARCTH